MQHDLPTICVIIAAFKKPRELQCVLESLAQQTHIPEEVIITEDNVSSDFDDLVREYRPRFPNLKHLQQVNKGFGKCKALNRAIAESTQSIVLFTDGDCLFRNDFIATHKRLAKPGRFITGGGHINIVSAFHTSTDLIPFIQNQSVFTDRFFKINSCGKRKLFRLSMPSLLKPFFNALTRRNALNGCNAAVWRHDAIKVKGFDEAMGYGAEDLNMGIRLNNIGVKGYSYRYSLPHLHLDHARGYKHTDIIANNVAFNKSIKHTNTFEPRQSCLNSHHRVN